MAQAGTIYKNGEPFYAITAEDKLWLARMIRSESSDWGDRKAQLWTIAQRFVLRNKRYESTLTQLVQNFSQPVNVKWSREGSACRPGGTHAHRVGPRPAPDECSEARLRNRDRARNRGAHELQQELQLIDEWAAGHVPNPVPKSVDWHASRLAPGSTQIGDYPNLFQATPASMRWSDNYVSVGGGRVAEDASRPKFWTPALSIGLFSGLVGGYMLVKGWMA